MPTVTNDGTELHYTIDGDDGPVVVAIEGLGYGRWMWQFATDALKDEFVVIRPDNRGTGNSETPQGPYTVEAMATDVRAVLEDYRSHNEKTGHVHLLGASMGGMIALSYAYQYDDVESLALFCTSPGGELATATPDDVLAHIMSAPENANERETIRHRMAPAVSDDFYEREPELVEQIIDWRLDGDASDEGREAQAAAVIGFDGADWLGAIDVPTLLLHGTDDRVLPVANGDVLAEELPNVTYERIEGGDHLFFIEERERVNDRLRSFLEAQR